MKSKSEALKTNDKKAFAKYVNFDKYVIEPNHKQGYSLGEYKVLPDTSFILNRQYLNFFGLFKIRRRINKNTRYGDKKSARKDIVRYEMKIERR